jgi:glycosyltransferase involved in cell wall biosynthesis
VIYNPVSEELAAAAHSMKAWSREIDVLFVGRLMEGKGILVLAQALRLLDRDGCPLRVRIVGDGGDRERMEASLRDVHALSITFTGFETGNALAQSYASARVLVVPSTEPEGMGMVVAEGMAFGLPVIASDQAALKEVVGEAGMIVRSGDAEALASALRTVLGDQDLWKDLSDRARLRSELFNMSNFRRNIADLLGEIAERCNL